MNVVDSSGWLEYFADGPNADVFAPAVESTAELVVPSITLLEVAKRTLAQRGEAAAAIVITAMQQGRVVDLDATLALRSARLGLELRLPLADSVILATARSFDAVLWTQDADFQGIPDVNYVPKT